MQGQGASPATWVMRHPANPRMRGQGAGAARGRPVVCAWGFGPLLAQPKGGIGYPPGGGKGRTLRRGQRQVATNAEYERIAAHENGALRSGQRQVATVTWGGSLGKASEIDRVGGGMVSARASA
ncbi:MAG: hypothetical protein KatS3mg058_4019 [Roseiflexus sp.]|nr:MAG: hypothetical protein KatS3mg058_4019 [Roseiflexus sp.]